MDTSEQHWQRLFVAALTERDLEKFSARLTAADDAIFNRLLELENEVATDVERVALRGYDAGSSPSEKQLLPFSSLTETPGLPRFESGFEPSSNFGTGRTCLRLHLTQKFA
jgi:hypothetical protein